MEPQYTPPQGIRKATADLNPGAPAVDTDVTVPSDVKVRLVFGDVQLDPSALNQAEVKWHAEETPGSGLVVVQNPLINAGGTGLDNVLYAFAVAGGAKYKWTKGGLAGTTESMGNYSFIDLY